MTNDSKSEIERAAEVYGNVQIAPNYYLPTVIYHAYMAGARKLLELAEAHCYEHTAEGKPTSEFIYLSDLRKLIDKPPTKTVN